MAEKVEETIKMITIPESLTIKELAEKMKLQPSAIVKKLFLQGQIAVSYTHLFRSFDLSKFWGMMSDGAMGGVSSLFNTAAIVGFGSVVPVSYTHLASADFDYADCFRYVHGDNGYYLDCNSDSDSDYYSVRN